MLATGMADFEPLVGSLIWRGSESTRRKVTLPQGFGFPPLLVEGKWIWKPLLTS